MPGSIGSAMIQNAGISRTLSQTLATKRSRGDLQSCLHACHLSLNVELATFLPGSYHKRERPDFSRTQPLSPVVYLFPPLVWLSSEGSWLQVQSSSEEEESHWPSRPEHHHLCRLLLVKTPEVSEIDLSSLFVSLSVSLCLFSFSNWAAHYKHMLKFFYKYSQWECPHPASNLIDMEPRDWFLSS